MKLTAELVGLSAQFINALKERELDLRSNKIPAIENLGATMDQFDTIDLSDNEIRKIENFPLLKRLGTLLISGNRVSRIEAGLQDNLPRLHTIILNNNLISDLVEVKALSSIKTLRTLSLIDNPCTKKQHYRLYVIHTLPQLKLLDFRNIKQKEREGAAALFGGKEGKELESTINSQRTFVPGSLSEVESSQKPGLSAEEQARIKAAIQNSSSLDEIARLERILKNGNLPEQQAAGSGGGVTSKIINNQVVEMEED